MGLDMYLSKRTYIGNNYREPDQQKKIVIEGIEQGRVSEIVENVGYWRKANAIHDWFVKNIQEGSDDCKDYYVSREDLQKLLDTVNFVLSSIKTKEGKVHNGTTFKNGIEFKIMDDGIIITNPQVCQENLPTTSGFFFGGIDYDGYYIDMLKETKEILEKALKEETGDFYYHSSW